MSVFNPNIPQPSDLLSNSQNSLLSNNQGLDTVFGADHTAFADSTSNKGFHKQITLYQVHSDPAQTFPSSMIYTKNSGTTPNQVTNLFFSYKPETGGDVVKQLAGSIFVEGGNDGFGGAYGLYKTPWNWNVFFGQSSTFFGSRDCVLSGTIPFGLNILTSQATAFGAGPYACSLSANGGTKNINMQTAGLMPIRWMVITD